MRLTLSWMERIAPALDVEPAELIAGKAMTDRHAGYVVVLDKNLREDDAQPILDAIRMIKGVVSVVPERGDAQLAIAEQRAIRRLYEKMREIETDLLGKF